MDWPWCEQVLERVGDSDVLITKEMPVPAHIIEQLPASVRLICEAGTGASQVLSRETMVVGRTGLNTGRYDLACKESLLSWAGIPCALCADFTYRYPKQVAYLYSVPLQALPSAFFLKHPPFPRSLITLHARHGIPYRIQQH